MTTALHATPDTSDGHRRMLRLAIPIVLANLTQPLLGLVDTAVAGHSGSATTLAGIALGGLFFSFVFWGFGFLRMGTTGLVSQAYGADDQPALRAHLTRALLLALLIGLSLLALQRPLIVQVLELIGGSTTVQHNARLYCQARIVAAPFALANYVVLGALLGLQRVRMALGLQILINLINILAVLLYVYGWHWGISGMGAATATADALGFVAGLMLLWRMPSCRPACVSWRALCEPQALRRLLLINRDLFLRTLCLLAAFGWFAHLGARQGDLFLAANALLLNFQTFMAYGLDGFAHATETLIGQAIGRQNRSAFFQAVRAGLLWTLLGALGFSLCYGYFGGAIIAQLTDQPAVRITAQRYLPWVVALPLVSCWSFLLDGVFIGATRTRELMLGMLLSLAFFFAASALLTGPFGNHGLWLALLIFMAVRAATLWPLLSRIGSAIHPSHPAD